MSESSGTRPDIAHAVCTVRLLSIVNQKHHLTLQWLHTLACDRYHSEYSHEYCGGVQNGWYRGWKIGAGKKPVIPQTHRGTTADAERGGAGGGIQVRLVSI